MSARVLVTNDDGIDSPGLAALARCARDSGLDTTIAAPLTEASGTGAGLVAAENGRRMAVRRRQLPGLADVPAQAVAAFPGLIVFAAMRGGFGAAPDVVLSGVNLGANLGRAVLHSGTVGAALTAGEFGARALAVSLDVPVGGADILHWASAAEVVRRVLPLVLEAEAGTVLNLNVPNLPADRIGPVRRARLTRFGMVQSRLERFDDGALKLVTVARDGEPEPDSDAGLLAAGHATITPLCSVTEDVDVQLPELAHTGG